MPVESPRDTGLLPTRPMSTAPAMTASLTSPPEANRLHSMRDVGAERLLEPALVLHDQVAVGHLLVGDADRLGRLDGRTGVGGRVGRRRRGRRRGDSVPADPWPSPRAVGSVAVGSSVADERRRRYRTRRAQVRRRRSTAARSRVRLVDRMVVHVHWLGWLMGGGPERPVRRGPSRARTPVRTAGSAGRAGWP